MIQPRPMQSHPVANEDVAHVVSQHVCRPAWHIARVWLAMQVLVTLVFAIAASSAFVANASAAERSLHAVEGSDERDVACRPSLSLVQVALLGLFGGAATRQLHVEPKWSLLSDDVHVCGAAAVSTPMRGATARRPLGGAAGRTAPSRCVAD
eukprot:CAMPEP_0176054956 /NCGR_PEP_ID=MMETSP0120_2-20121206/27350_1 /TAXON_ID=160619 /ORGANISM="Kryptoperidinium foliaceum, Strain CCMP 1326" /LENGTH=151 /DNA_ID=CAMNT_0017388433 /DNA_START=13 /DNA_END=466 /DNA_ORIENTATION=-